LEAMHLARHIYPPSVSNQFFSFYFSIQIWHCLYFYFKGLQQCDGIQLQSLPNDDLLVSPKVK
jgi:hypothetical protein